jgi:hypothetical protein
MVGTHYGGFRSQRLAVAAAILSIATKAAAQDAPASSPAKARGNEVVAEPPREQLGSQRQLVLSVERLLSITARLPHTETLSYAPGSTQTSSSAGIALFSPTLAIDGFICRHLSLGLSGSLGGFSDKYETTTVTDEGTIVTTQHDANAMALLAPRVGAAWTSESGLGVWARAGLDVYMMSYSTSLSVAGEGSHQTQGDVSFSFRGELLVTYSPAAHVVLMVGPFVRTAIDPEWAQSPVVGLNVHAGMFF